LRKTVGESMPDRLADELIDAPRQHGSVLWVGAGPAGGSGALPGEGWGSQTSISPKVSPLPALLGIRLALNFRWVLLDT
jgi:hypothetical protein